MSNEVKVWDPLVRLFHWVLVVAFVVAYLSGEGEAWMDIHSISGYIIIGLVVFRIIWGFVGPRYARFSDFIKPLSVVKTYFNAVMKFKAERYLGHNPAGAVMIVLLLVSLLITTLSGIVVYGAEEHAGPLAGLMSQADEVWEEIFEEVHEIFANFTVLLIVIHIAGVLLESLMHGENLVRAMFTGRKLRDIE